MIELKTKEPFSFTIPIEPTTKKNSQSIKQNMKTGRPFITQGPKYLKYERDCGAFIPRLKKPISGEITVQAHFYRKYKHTVDLVNLLQALLDILTKYGVIEDDCYKVVVSVDGSRVFFDKENPRTEVTIFFNN